MSTEEMSAEESAAMEEMQADTPVVEAPEEAPAEEITPEPPAEPVKAEEDPKPPEGFVPHQAMHAERMKAKAMRDENDALAARIAELEKQMSGEAKPPEFVDPLVDPEGFRRWAEHNAAQQSSKVEQTQEQIAQQAAAVARQQEAARLEQEFAAKTPDYQNAVQHLHDSRVSELRALGYGDAEISAQVAKDANAIFDAAQSTGMNPAEMLYYRAQSMGYTKAAPTPQPAAQITARAEAQKQTQGLSNAGGAESSGELTAAQLAEMSDAEFAKLDSAVIARAMGA